ncbi:Transcription factor [Nymphaea thermarum]|nr:Transcription factor [Nymphaea thermarum]
MATGNLSWQWNPNAIPPPPLPLPPSTPLHFHASPSMFQPYQQPPSLLLSSSAWNDNQEFPESWCQLLLGGLVGDYESHGNINMKRTAEYLEHQVLIPSSNTYMTQVKREVLNGGFVYSHHQEHHNQELQTTASSSQQISHLVSSPTSCTSYSSNSNVLDFSSGKSEKQETSGRSPECNTSATGAAVKKAKLQAPGAGQSSFKVRKEKLGDRVTALHQLVSPFGKTDTASVLLEAIGYIRFLQAQIAALSSPYMSTASGSLTHPVKVETEGCGCSQDSDQKVADEPKKDLRSRGLCLVSVSRILNAGSENGVGFWPAAAGAGFQ